MSRTSVFATYFEQATKKFEVQHSPPTLLNAMAEAIANQRRKEDRAMGLPIPNGDEFPYLPMDERAAQAALDAYNNFSGEK